MTNTIQLNLSIAEMNTVLEALGGMPYFKVYELIAKLQMAAQQQLKEGEKPASVQLPAGQNQTVSNGVHAE